MTKPRYLPSCVAGSQVRGDTPNPDPDNSEYQFGVNFNNGNSNINHRSNNTGFVLPVRSLAAPASEYQSAAAGAVTFDMLYAAYMDARRGKKPSNSQLRFDNRWADRIIEIQDAVNDGTWSPSPTTCFIAEAPKAREIHAPTFDDRVVHHLVVPPLEAIYERRFIDDSYANRKGKGTLKAVKRVWQFVRQVYFGQEDGWFLQLDIKNFFNSIPRKKLYQALKRVMEREGVPEAFQRIVHALLRQSPVEIGVRHRSTPAQRALVPPHKRLENAPKGRGLPIGNLSSQFFANVYLDALDQFVKHVLKAQRYVRYVDDFVIVHKSREQLERWLVDIRTFLSDQLGLELKADIRLRPLSAGIDFLGYVVLPTHLRVRRRVISHARQKLDLWGSRHIVAGNAIATPDELREIRSTWSSYGGHFKHASSWRLQQQFHGRYPWLHDAAMVRRRFSHRAEGKRLTIPIGDCA